MDFQSPSEIDLFCYCQPGKRERVSNFSGDVILYSTTECNYAACPSRLVLFVSLQLRYIQSQDKGRVKQKKILTLQTLAVGSPRLPLAGSEEVLHLGSILSFVSAGLEVTWLLSCAIVEEHVHLFIYVSVYVYIS